MAGITFSLYDVFSYVAPGFIFLGVLVFRNILGFGSIVIRFYHELEFLPFLIVTIICCYLLGHLLSIISAATIENRICKKLKWCDGKFSLETVLGHQLEEQLKNKFKEITHADYMPKCNLRYIICYIQENSPSVYSTAFVFLTFYGMARSMVLVCLCEAFFQLISIIVSDCTCSKLLTFLFELFVSYLFFVGYVKFRTYFHSQIYHGFLLKGKEED